jgi:hypothetical protein
MYNSSGERVREGYYDKNEPLTGTLEEKFENGRLSKSVNYEEGLRSGLTQTWYTNGQLKSQTRYENGRKSGPTLTYLENGEPDAATKAALIQLAREAEAAKADSIQQAHNEALELRRVLIEHHKQDSLRKEQERHMFD